MVCMSSDILDDTFTEVFIIGFTVQCSSEQGSLPAALNLNYTLSYGGVTILNADICSVRDTVLRRGINWALSRLCSHIVFCMLWTFWPFGEVLSHQSKKNV